MSPLETALRADPEPTQPDARGWVQSVASDRERPVVVFGVVWCGFCRAAMNLLEAAGTPYRYIDTEDRAQLEGVAPVQVRTALRDLTGSRTVPQVFIGGEAIGGATELYAELRSGRLADRLNALGLPFEEPH